MERFLSYFGEFISDPGAIPAFRFEYLTTLGFAAIVMMLGRFLVSKSRTLQKYAIPAPVVSGILFSLVVSFIKMAGIVDLTFDAYVMKDLAQNLFFLAIGYNFSTQLMQATGKKLVINIIWATCLLLVLQDTVGLLVGKLVGLDPFLALQASSSAMSGGVGTAGAFGPIFIEMGAPANATEFGVAAGTVGNVLGSLVGGPVAAFLISRNNLKSDNMEMLDLDSEENLSVLKNNRMIRAFAMMLLMAAGGIVLKYILDFIPVVKMPKYVCCLFVGAIIRNILEKSDKDIYIDEVTAIQEMFLELYLALVLMTIDITAISGQASSLLLILIAQAILVGLFAIFISYRAFGKDYGAAVMAAGNCGWGCGSGPNSLANIKAVMQEYGYHEIAWVFYTSFATIVTDIFNPILLSVLGSLIAR